MKFSSLKNLVNKKLKINLNILLITIAVIMLFALIFGCIFGFNKGFDITGGTQIVVDLGNDTLQSGADKDENKFINDASKKAKEIIASHGGTVHSLQVQSTDFGKSLVINIREKGKKNSSKIREIRLALNEEFNDFEEYLKLSKDKKYLILNNQLFDLTKSTAEIESLIQPNIIIATIASLLFALTLIAIYACFRFKVPSGLTVAFGGLLNLLLFCAFMILSRIEINAYFFALLAVVLLISLYNSLSFFFDIKEKLKDPKFNTKTNRELADIVLEENYIKNVCIYAVCAGIALIIGLFGVVSILHLGLATIFALVILFITQNLIVPDFWVLVNKKNELVRPEPKQKKNDVEIASQKNNKDKSAKVVEVEEDEDEETDLEETEIEEANEDEVEIEEKESSNADDDEVVIEVLEDDTKKD